MELKTKYKYIHFDETVKGTWYCYNNSSEGDLGRATYYKRWKQWVMEFEGDMVFNNQCLIDIADFLTQLNKNRKGG